MPKHDIFLNPGDEIPDEILPLLTSKFSVKSIDKLKRFGGRIQLSLTAPFTDRKKQKKDLLIDQAFINKLASSTIAQAQDILAKLTLKQTKEVAKFMHFPIASKVTVEEARNQLISLIFSDDTWKKISR